LQHALYRAAKADPGRRFRARYDKVYRGDVLERAWGLVRRNRGRPGLDQVTIVQVERYGVDRLLDRLAAALRDGSWRPLPARWVFIPKPGTAEQRPLSVPAVTGRIVQAAVKLVAEPIFEADMLACSYGFRLGGARTTPCGFSSMRRGGAGVGWLRRTSPPALRRSRMTGWCRRSRSGSVTATC
jgi:RNA-directed DNA polymerase